VADEDFAALSKQFETLTQKLSESQDPQTRKRLLAELRDILTKLDRVNLKKRPE
jgi:hypothetical protein